MSSARRMELRHLRYFVAVAETLHFSRAAEKLHLTQPALSRQIRDLENEIGVQLFRRHGTRTALTREGAQFAQRARRILAEVEQAVTDVRASGHLLRFGHYGSLWVEHFASALAAFARRHRKLEVQPIEMAPAELVTALRDGTIDFAILGPANDAIRREFSTRRVACMDAEIALSAAHPLAKKRKLALPELRSADWIVWDERLYPGRAALLAEAAKQAGFKPRIVQTVDSLASLFVRVATSSAVSYVLPIARRFPHSGVVFAKLAPPLIQFELNVAWRRVERQSEILAELAEDLASVTP